MREGQGSLQMLRSVQHLYQVCSHTFSYVTLMTCSNKAEGVKNLSDCVACQSVVWEAMRLADKSLIQVESAFPGVNLEDFHSLNTDSLGQIHETISSFVTTMNNISAASTLSYREWVEMGRPTRPSDIQTEPSIPEVPHETPDSSGPSTPRMNLDDASDAVFFVCSQCNSLCDSYTDSAPTQSAAETNSNVCFDCWRNMVDDRVEQSEFNIS